MDRMIWSWRQKPKTLYAWSWSQSLEFEFQLHSLLLSSNPALWHYCNCKCDLFKWLVLTKQHLSSPKYLGELLTLQAYGRWPVLFPHLAINWCRGLYSFVE